jgi:hypothetical protein
MVHTKARVHTYGGIHFVASEVGALSLEPFVSLLHFNASDTKKTPRTTHIQPKSRIRLGNDVSVDPTLRGIDHMRRNESVVEEVPSKHLTVAA